MNMTKKSDEITQACHGYGVKVVHTLKSKRMMLVEPDCSDSVQKYLDRKINVFNNHLPVHYPDRW